MTNATSRLLASLTKGERPTAKQISAWFDVANPYDLVYNLRNEGYAIYLNRHSDTKGRFTNKYRLGHPTREMIAELRRAARY